MWQAMTLAMKVWYNARKLEVNYGGLLSTPMIVDSAHESYA